MSFAPTDALSMNVVLTAANSTFTFDCLEVAYEARIHGAYTLRALIASDVNDFAFQAKTSNIQLGMWSKIEVQSDRFGSLVFQGKINRITGSDKYANGQELVWIECVPECHELFTNVRSGIYLNGSVLDIIKRGVVGRFNSLGYQNTTVTQSLSQNADNYYPPQNSMTQFGESDMAFALRNMAEYGIWANFRQDYTGNSGITLLLGDHNGAFNEVGPITILSNMNHEGSGLYNLELTTEHLVDSVRAIYFDESQNQYLMETATLSTGTGENLDHHCLGNLLTQTQVNNIADTVKSSLKVQHQQLKASFQGLSLQPGDLIEVPINDNNTPFVIFAIDYEFAKGDDERSTSAQHSQNHTLTAYALVDDSGNSITYRAPIWVKTASAQVNFTREYPNYAYQGILSGCYGMPTGAIVVPDALGNIPLQFPYNYTEVCGKTPARYTRLISLSNEGGTTGRTFPIYADTELQITFANGNMDYPLIKGAAANADTGHVHNSTVQQRAHYALPQGQYLTYSNVPGDHNFVTMGAQHSEGDSRSFMMLSNHQDPNNPGVKKLDQQMITNQSNEQVTSGDSSKFHAGNQNVVNGQSNPLPLTYIQFVIGDQTNIQNPTSAPMLDDYLQGISADFALTKQNGTVNAIYGGATKLTGKVYAITQLLSPSVDPTVPVDITEIKLTLIHNGNNGTDVTTAVNVIAQNSSPILPTNTIIVQASDWQKNKVTDAAGNIYYTIYLNLLAPARLFNFRQDWYEYENQQTLMPADDLAVYQALKPYFTPEAYTNSPMFREQFLESELQFFQTQGNNVTLFIHGYNVGFGNWPTYYKAYNNRLIPFYSADLYQDDTTMQTKFGGLYNPQQMFGAATGQWNPIKMSALLGTEAHKWLLSIEHSLNQGAGFDGNDYSKYTRLVGISWQGNPASPADYMTAVGMTTFAANKTFTLIQQLHAKGIKINLMAHSLGNGVLMHLLNLCGQAGIQVDHAFLWEPAIPNNSFDDNSKTNFLPLALKNTVTQQAQDIPYEYNYPQVQQGAAAFTVLYSNEDTILGAIPTGTSAWTVLKQTDHDPAAGAAVAAPAAGVAVIDKFSRLHLKSIYQVANLMVYPLSYFTAATADNLTAFYKLWAQHYPGWQDQNGNIQPFPASLDTQLSNMTKAYPGLFNAGSDLVYMLDTDDPAIDATYGNLSDEEKLTAAVMHFLHLLLPFTEEMAATPDAMTDAGLHANYVATLLLTSLLTPAAQPADALGYSGVLQSDDFYNSSKYFHSPQQDPSGKDLCVDHSAMLFPTDDFMKYIYTRDLMHTSGLGFDYFGKWKPA